MALLFGFPMLLVERLQITVYSVELCLESGTTCGVSDTWDESKVGLDIPDDATETLVALIAGGLLLVTHEQN
jgi:hypothetical protein